MMNRLVLFSGGVDSTTALHWALSKPGSVSALTIDYGQRHRVEVQMARRIAKSLSIPHWIFPLALNRIGGSALTDPDQTLPRHASLAEMEPGIPPTYVPFRNGIFLSLGAAVADANAMDRLVCGFNIIDSPDYPDTRREFVKAMEKSINLGTRSGAGGRPIRIEAPFVGMKKSEIIKLGLSLGADYSLAVTCYAGQEVPCSTCSACLLREQAWKELGIRDPLIIRLERKGEI